MPLAKILGSVSLVALAALGMNTVQASSHREAPLITQTPKIDATDFYFFRSYEPGRSDYVTAIANYIPLQNPGDGPNYYMLDPDAYYDINFDLNADGREDLGFRFRFTNTNKDIKLNVGQKRVAIPLIQAGQVTAENPTGNLNVIETYEVQMLTYATRGTRTAPVRNTDTVVKKAGSGEREFRKPVDHIGLKTLPDYAAYAARHVYDVTLPGDIPGCTQGRIFVGQRKDSFVVNVGEIFDLINIANPIGEEFADAGKDYLADKNVTTLALEIPAACVKGMDDVTGAWTAAGKVTSRAVNPPVIPQRGLEQLSRLANPLVNEVVIGLKDKDTFNASVPADDIQFADYVTNPTLPALIELLFPSAVAPTAFPREDLVATFLTGLPNINQPTQYHVTPAEEMRLNLASPITPAGAQNRLGVIAGDAAGYPNGRRPGDDVVDISLRVAMGKLYALGVYGEPSDAPAGNLEFTDGAYIDSSFFDTTFPYLRTPIPGSPKSATTTP